MTGVNPCRLALFRPGQSDLSTSEPASQPPLFYILLYSNHHLLVLFIGVPPVNDMQQVDSVICVQLAQLTAWSKLFEWFDLLHHSIGKDPLGRAPVGRKLLLSPPRRTLTRKSKDDETLTRKLCEAGTPTLTWLDEKCIPMSSIPPIAVTNPPSPSAWLWLSIEGNWLVHKRELSFSLYICTTACKRLYSLARPI